MTHSDRRPPRLSPSAIALALTLAFSACCARGGLPPIALANSEIVATHAKSAFDVHFGSNDKPALEQFVGATASAPDRAALGNEWTRIPTLAAKGTDFLSRKVFEKADADGSWNRAVSPAEQERAYVAGTRAAARLFLMEKVVEAHAKHAFEQSFAPVDRPAFEQFIAATATATDRAALVAQWRLIGSLGDRGAAFLSEQVFQKAERDPAWNAGASAMQKERAFVAGTCDAARRFATGR